MCLTEGDEKRRERPPEKCFCDGDEVEDRSKSEEEEVWEGIG